MVDLIETLLQYGMAGIFIIYLIYDRQIIIKSLQASIDANTASTGRLSLLLEDQQKNKGE